MERHLEAGEPTGWFEPVHARAIPHLERLPWAAGTPSPALLAWLDDPAKPRVVGRAAVVGCGVGDDAVVLSRRGFEVTGLDVSPTALRWAARRFPHDSVHWRRADVLAPDGELTEAFDLVVAVGVVSWLPGVVRDAAMTGIAALVADGGTALVVDMMATSAGADARVEGPPWPQAPSELATYRAAGLVREALEHERQPASPLMQVVTVWRRPSTAPLPGA